MVGPRRMDSHNSSSKYPTIKGSVASNAQTTSAALTRDLESVRASVDAIKEELSTKSATLDEVVMHEREAQARLHTLDDEKKAKEQLLESAQKMLSKRDFSSSAVNSSAVAHITEKLRRDFPFDNGEEGMH
jgi:chromosome segregation ATPase